MNGHHHGGGHDPPDPGAGDDWTFEVPDKQILCPVAIRFKLVTSSTSGTRTVGIRYYNSSATYFESYSTSTQSNSESMEYCFYVGANEVSESGPDFTSASLALMCLGEGFTIASIIHNLKGNDVLSDVTIFGSGSIDPS